MEKQLTAVWIIIHIVVVLADGAIVDLPFGWNVRYAGRDVVPHVLGYGIVRKNRRGLPYRGEFVDEIVHGSVVVRRALGIRICDIGCRGMKGKQGGASVGGRERRCAPVI